MNSPQTLSIEAVVGMKQAGEKITVLTAYDASMSKHLEAAGIDVILVGDSLGMVVQGHDSTLPVTVDDMIYHCRLVARARERALLVVDMPYHSYTTVDMALSNAQRLMDEGRADMVKLEGAGAVLDAIEAIVADGIPVCGHLGLLPQSIEELGGYKVQGREQAAADKMLADARALEAAGASMMVLECIPSSLGKRISEAVTVPTIGIGAGPDCDGQVLVLYDLLGLTPGKRPKFSKDFLSEMPAGKGITAAIRAYVDAVKSGVFPAPEHGFK
ncbi:3-methyl-2-oxobutanoate hydroxymethyltransferase [hydrothermal vent metagenome]|uniref:3-methyl-2-oxobutanoate hydroxymethyltransferase n=1 Tax=hydrothermal vent metagenome TaxID=652676 RepID=A0A3B1B1I3_9ZZZZ